MLLPPALALQIRYSDTHKHFHNHVWVAPAAYWADLRFLGYCSRFLKGLSKWCWLTSRAWTSNATRSRSQRLNYSPPSTPSPSARMRWCYSRKRARPVNHKIFPRTLSHLWSFSSSVTAHKTYSDLPFLSPCRTILPELIQSCIQKAWARLCVYVCVCVINDQDVNHGADLKQADLLKEVTTWNGSYSTLQSYWFLCLVYLYVLLLLMFSKQKYVLLFCTKSIFTVWTEKLFACLIFMSHISSNDIILCVFYVQDSDAALLVHCMYIYVWIYKTLIKYVYHRGCDLQCVNVSARDMHDHLKTSQERNWRSGKGWAAKSLHLYQLSLSTMEFTFFFS